MARSKDSTDEPPHLESAGEEKSTNKRSKATKDKENLKDKGSRVSTSTNKSNASDKQTDNKSSDASKDKSSGNKSSGNKSSDTNNGKPSDNMANDERNRNTRDNKSNDESKGNARGNTSGYTCEKDRSKNSSDEPDANAVNNATNTNIVSNRNETTASNRNATNVGNLTDVSNNPNQSAWRTAFPLRRRTPILVGQFTNGVITTGDFRSKNYWYKNRLHLVATETGDNTTRLFTMRGLTYVSTTPWIHVSYPIDLPDIESPYLKALIRNINHNPFNFYEGCSEGLIHTFTEYVNSKTKPEPETHLHGIRLIGIDGIWKRNVLNATCLACEKTVASSPTLCYEPDYSASSSASSSSGPIWPRVLEESEISFDLAEESTTYHGAYYLPKEMMDAVSKTQMRERVRKGVYADRWRGAPVDDMPARYIEDQFNHRVPAANEYRPPPRVRRESSTSGVSSLTKNSTTNSDSRPVISSTPHVPRPSTSNSTSNEQRSSNRSDDRPDRSERSGTRILSKYQSKGAATGPPDAKYGKFVPSEEFKSAQERRPTSPKYTHSKYYRDRLKFWNQGSGAPYHGDGHPRHVIEEITLDDTPESPKSPKRNRRETSPPLAGILHTFRTPQVPKRKIVEETPDKRGDADKTKEATSTKRQRDQSDSRSSANSGAKRPKTAHVTPTPRTGEKPNANSSTNKEREPSGSKRLNISATKKPDATRVKLVPIELLTEEQIAKADTAITDLLTPKIARRKEKEISWSSKDGQLSGTATGQRRSERIKETESKPRRGALVRRSDA